MSNRLKVVHVVHSFEIGGLENGVVNLINDLDDQFSHVILCLSKSGRMTQRVKNPDVSIVEMRFPTDRFRFPILKLARELRRVAPDIVHTRGWSSVDAIMAARAARVPRVIHGEHGWEAADPRGQNRKRQVIRKCLSPLVDRFVAVSDHLRTWLIQTVGIPERKVACIHNGVDTQKFAPLADAQSAQRAAQSVVDNGSVLSPQPSSPSALRHVLCLPEDAVVIGTVGRLDPVKDHRSLLQAFASLARLNTTVRLVIVGEGPMRGEIESQIKELKIDGKVHLLGERQDIAEVLRTFDVFALTSIAEGISNTILEAMASALPIVATRVGGNAELVEPGVCGQLVEAGDVAGLSAALQSYLLDPRLRADHGRRARARAERSFSLERMAAQYADLYFSVTTTGLRKDRKD